jgi:hypothetical protein
VSTTTITHAELLLRADLESDAVEIGALRSKWHIDQLEFPLLRVTFTVPTAVHGPGRLTIIWNCEGYPTQAPTGYPTIPGTDNPLPAASRPTVGRCASAFRPDWENGLALYLGIDRRSLPGHPDWAATHPGETWDPAVGIVRAFDVVWRTLNESEAAS